MILLLWIPQVGGVIHVMLCMCIHLCVVYWCLHCMMFCSVILQCMCIPRCYSSCEPQTVYVRNTLAFRPFLEIFYSLFPSQSMHMMAAPISISTYPPVCLTVYSSMSFLTVYLFVSVRPSTNTPSPSPFLSATTSTLSSKPTYRQLHLIRTIFLNSIFRQSSICALLDVARGGSYSTRPQG